MKKYTMKEISKAWNYGVRGCVGDKMVPGGGYVMTSFGKSYAGENLKEFLLDLKIKKKKGKK